MIYMRMESNGRHLCDRASTFGIAGRPDDRGTGFSGSLHSTFYLELGSLVNLGHSSRIRPEIKRCLVKLDRTRVQLR